MSRILFVAQRLGLGGSASSLLNMLELLEQSGCKVDLFIMEHSGMYLEQASRCANLLPEAWRLASSMCEPSTIKRYGLRGLVNRSLLSIKCKISDKKQARELIYQKTAENIDGYDVVIAYQEGAATNFARYIRAKKKIAWVHTIYERFTQNSTHEEMHSLYSEYEKIVCVAPAAVAAFQRGLPEVADRVCLIPNPLNSKRIIAMSKQPQDDIAFDVENVIVSVGRLSKEKQYDMAIRAAEKLQTAGISYKWYIIGDGAEKSNLDLLKKEKKLENRVILLGARNNPYPIVSRADVLVISSLYEAQPMVANEALILDVPVITTNYPSAMTLVQCGHNGIICDMSEEGLHFALKQFFLDAGYQKRLKEGAKDFTYDNTDIIKAFLNMIKF